MTSAAALANSPKTFLDRDNWMRALLASTLDHAAVRVGCRLALHFNVDNGPINPSFATLEHETHLPERSIYRLVSVLEHKGWIAIQRTGGRLKNSYVLLTPDTMTGVIPDAMTGLDGPNPDNTTRVNPDNTTRVKATNPDMNPDKRCTPTLTRGATTLHTEKNQEKRKKRGKSKTLCSPPDFASRGKKKAADSNNEEAFQKFWAAYPRRVSKGHARKAWDVATKRGVDPEAMIAGAGRYAIQRQDQDPKYTKHPATWINGSCWEDEPDGAPVIDEAGNVIAYEPRHSRPEREKTMDEIADELIELNRQGLVGWQS
jgi:hypothetical protein